MGKDRSKWPPFCPHGPRGLHSPRGPGWLWTDGRLGRDEETHVPGVVRLGKPDPTCVKKNGWEETCLSVKGVTVRPGKADLGRPPRAGASEVLLVPVRACWRDGHGEAHRPSTYGAEQAQSVCVADPAQFWCICKAPGPRP